VDHILEFSPGEKILDDVHAILISLCRWTSAQTSDNFSDFFFFLSPISNQLQQKRKNTTRGPGQLKNETKNESTRGQCFRRCGPISSRHGCHKAGVTSKGDFKGVLNHKDPNTIITENQVDDGWEPSWVARKKHAPPKDSLSSMGSPSFVRFRRGRKQEKMEELSRRMHHAPVEHWSSRARGRHTPTSRGRWRRRRPPADTREFSFEVLVFFACHCVKVKGTAVVKAFYLHYRLLKF